MPDPRDAPLNLAAIASACEAWLRVWRDSKAEPAAFGAVTVSLLDAALASPAPAATEVGEG